MDTILAFLAHATPTLIYLAGVVFLFLRLEKTQKSHSDSLMSLVERYHTQVQEQVHTLAIISERLDKPL